MKRGPATQVVLLGLLKKVDDTSTDLSQALDVAQKSLESETEDGNIALCMQVMARVMERSDIDPQSVVEAVEARVSQLHSAEVRQAAMRAMLSLCRSLQRRGDGDTALSMTAVYRVAVKATTDPDVLVLTRGISLAAESAVSNVAHVQRATSVAVIIRLYFLLLFFSSMVRVPPLSELCISCYR